MDRVNALSRLEDELGRLRGQVTPYVIPYRYSTARTQKRRRINPALACGIRPAPRP